jgi:hypothetical protein
MTSGRVFGSPSAPIVASEAVAGVSRLIVVCGRAVARIVLMVRLSSSP